MKERFSAEATAVLRRTGSWSVFLGPGGFLEHLYLRRTISPAPALERRLGILAACLGSLLSSALESAGKPDNAVRVTLRCALPLHGTRSNDDLKVEGQLSVDGDTTLDVVTACYETKVRTDPLVLLMTRDLTEVDVRVDVRSSTHIGVG